MAFIPAVDGYMYGLNADNGNIIWRFRADKSVCSEPLVIGAYVFFGSWDGFFYKFDKKTGKLIWKYKGGGSDSGVAIGFDGKIILPGDGMRCIDAETGEVLWNPELKGGLNATPAYHDGQVFVAIRPLGGLLHELEDNKILALDARTGKINWSFDNTGGHTAPVVGNNGYVYCGSGTNPYFFAFNEKGNGDGTTKCLFRVKMANKLIESTPALYRGRAYVLSSGGYLYAIE
jgi:outer membrane protein assembly factor BamB